MMPLTAHRVSAILLIVSTGLSLIGILMWTGRNMLMWFTETTAYLNWERGSLIAAFVAGALGVALLEVVLREAGETVLARLGATAFLIGAVIAVVVEASFLSAQVSMPALVVVMVEVLLVAEAILGAALLASRLLPAWAGWTVVAWNIGWLIVLPIMSPRDIYYPFIHFLPLLLIGVTLLVTR